MTTEPIFQIVISTMKGQTVKKRGKEDEIAMEERGVLNN